MTKKNKDLFHKIGFYFLATMFILLPFHAFLTTYFTSLLTETTKDNLSSISFIIASWKEILMVLMTFVILINSIVKKKLPFKPLLLDFLIFVLFIWGLASIYFQSDSLMQGLLGVRFDFEFFIFYWILRSIPLTLADIKKLFKYLIGSSVLVIILGFIQINLPCDFMTNFGYSPYISSWVSSKPLPCGHGLGGNIKILRMMSTFSGPNQLASFLLMTTIISWAMLSEHLKNIKTLVAKSYLSISFVVLSLTALYFTHSRGALLALLISFFFMLVLQAKDSKKTFGYLTFAIVIIVLLFAGNILLNPSRINSTQEHLEKPIEGIKLIIKNPWGLGIGMAGPASMRFPEDGSKAIISENWYIQIAQEFGLVGAFIFFLLLSSILRFLFQSYQKIDPDKASGLKTFTASIIAVYFGLLINNLFLHTFSSDMITSLIFFGMLAVCINLIGKNKYIIKRNGKAGNKK